MLKKIAIPILSIVLLIVLFEFVGRSIIFVLETKKPSGFESENILSYKEPILGFGLKKNLRKDLGTWTVTTNNFGFRTPKDIDENDTHEFRIFVLGGSTVFGWNVNDEDVITSRLQKIIEGYRSPKKITVYNAGVPWYASWHETANLIFKILPLKPDMVIVFNGLNEVAMGMQPTWQPIYKGFTDPFTQVVYEKTARGENLITRLLSLSPTLSYFQIRQNTKKSVVKGVYRSEVWDQYLRHTSVMYEISKAYKFDFQVFLQPIFGIYHRPTEEEIKTNGSSLSVKEFAENFRKLYLEGEERLNKESKFPFISLASAFKNETNRYYIDGLHYMPEGNELLAKLMFEKVIKKYINAPHS